MNYRPGATVPSPASTGAPFAKLPEAFTASQPLPRVPEHVRPRPLAPVENQESTAEPRP